ncbi:MAG: TIGR01459 family HAD-type hydrolase [Shimia sp.]
MTTRLESLAEVADRYDVIVLDQWGVLHDGTSPFPFARDAVSDLHAAGMRLAVLSNSGKRAAPNADRIEKMGFSVAHFETVMTSGEALWRDIKAGRIAERAFYAIERAPGDAARWAEGLDITLTGAPINAAAILLMGLPDDAPRETGMDALGHALSEDLPVYCTNPDRASPRAGGAVVVSPGALAHAHQDKGGVVRFYGKPHAPVFRAVEAALGVPPGRLLMVGDSLEHDIAGGHEAGWDTAFIEGGLHAAHFEDGDVLTSLGELAQAEGTPTPTFSLPMLR